MIDLVKSAMLLVVLFAAGILHYMTAPYLFHPLCKSNYITKQSATIEVNGVEYTSKIVSQWATPRSWISSMASGACPEKHGRAHSFRLRDDIVVLTRSSLCSAAIKRLNRGERVDVVTVCEHKRGPKTGAFSWQKDGYIIDDAKNPSRWKAFYFDDGNVPVRLVRHTASNTLWSPTDQFEVLAPNLMVTHFEPRDGSFETPLYLFPSQRNGKKMLYSASHSEFQLEMNE